MNLRRALSMLLVPVLLLPFAAARAEKVRDGKDVRGRFDLRVFAQDRREGNALRFRLGTHGEWTVNDVKRGGFAIRVDSDRDPDPDRFVLIEYDEGNDGKGRLMARITEPDGTVIEVKRARHRNPRGLVVWLDRRRLGIEKGGFRTNAYSVLYSDQCPKDGCRDPVPDEGWMKAAFGGLCAGREPDITGTAGDDVIETSGRRVVVAGLAGGDVIRVEQGSVIACGGAGPDLLIGGRRTDQLYGGSGEDELRPGKTGGRPNRAYGGPGNDLLYGGSERDRMFGQSDNDYLNGRAGNDFLDGGRGADDIDGGRGDDTCRNARTLSGC